MARRRLLLGSIFLSCAVLAGACSVGNDCDFGLCEEYKAPPDSGVDGPEIPSDCVLASEPKDEATCVVDAVGIFVSPNGVAGAIGTKANPVRTITEGLQKAVSSGRGRVYVCAGQYPESISVPAAMGIYGGFDCNWNYTAVLPQINSPSSPGLAVRSVAAQVIIEDLAIAAPSDTATAGSSAIGALVLETALSLKRVTIVAAAGQPGAKGGSLSNYGKPASMGASAAGSVGGGETACTCIDNTTSTGGKGADGTGGGFSVGTSVPAAPVGGGGIGTSNTTTCEAGHAGSDGAAVPANDPLTTPPGIVTAAGWDISKLASTAPNGNPGQGGGGGGAETSFTAAGGGGGCGGCGGAGANAGTNGGASIGLLSYNSMVTLDACKVTTAIGGKGGSGGDGQPGQGGGAPGGSASCAGGAGGNGAGGNGGPGGAGGDSIAIASGGAAAAPTMSGGTVLTVGSGGPGGDGGDAGAGNGTAGNPGKSGLTGRALKTLPQ